MWHVVRLCLELEWFRCPWVLDDDSSGRTATVVCCKATVVVDLGRYEGLMRDSGMP